MNTAQQEQRNRTADILKGFLIVCVIFGHSMSQINGLRGVAWYDSPLNVFLTAFEMPMMIMISGYFLGSSMNRHHAKDLLVRRAGSVLLPILVWAVAPAVVRLALGFLKGQSVNVVETVYSAFVGKYWYLVAYLISCILVVAVERFLGKVEKRRRGAIKTCAYIAITVFLHFNPRYFANTEFMFPFFLVGLLISKYNLLNNTTFRKVIIGAAALFCLLICFYRAEYSVYLLPSYLLEGVGLKKVPILLYRWLLGICGSAFFYVAIVTVERYLGRFLMVRGLNFLGKKTLELYILSVLLQGYLQSAVRMLLPDVAWLSDFSVLLVFAPLFFVVLTTLCLVLESVISKNKYTRKLLLGK